MTVILIILALVFSIISGISKAILDLSSDGKFKNPKLNKDNSWKNKYKNNDFKQGAKFFGSTTLFVALTDIWHLSGLIFRLSFATVFLSIGILTTYSNWYWFMLLCYPFSMSVFHIFYTYKIINK